MKQKIIIIGYFNHDNIGDEQYKITFDHVLDASKNDLIYIDCDLIKDYTINDTDTIIIGGGDILNNYFLDQIHNKFADKPNKIIAVSVGIPYSNILINTNKLNIIDYIFIRTEQEMELLSKYYFKDRIFYLPDISYYLINNNISFKDIDYKHNFITTENKLISVQNNGQKIIAISLNRHIYTKETTNYYNSIISEMAKVIQHLVNLNYFIILYPFNTSSSIKDYELNMENDILIHTDIFNLINSKNIMNINFTLSVNQMFYLYRYFYLTIPMRFHGCLFSIYNKVPLIPVYTTKKIKNLLIDINWNNEYILETNSKDIPISIDKDLLLAKINNVIENYIEYENILRQACHKFNDNLELSMPKLTKLINSHYVKNIIPELSKNETIIIKLYNKLNEFTNNVDFRLIKDDSIKNTIVSIVSYYLTNNVDSKYNYGLFEKMFNESYNYKEEWKWIICDHELTNLNVKKLFSNPNGLFNINYVDQNDYSNAHRSGWQFVYNSIKHLHNEDSNLLIDLYLDKTFHWKKEVYKILNLIPYKKNWMGFIHHTFENKFSNYNNYNLINCPEFIESLKLCKGLFVLSKYLKKQFIHELNKLNIRVPIYVLYHPTEINNVPEFSFKKFLNNKQKKLVHVGGWLRNIFSFYNMKIPKVYKFSKYKIFKYKFTKCIKKKTYTMEKYALKGSNMNNYFPADDFLCTLKNTLNNNYLTNHLQNCSTDHPKNCSTDNLQNCSTDHKITNNWYKHYYDYTKEMCDSVNIINKLSNQEYDNLLTENIVFINLIDASAVNTLIECMVRNTPIIINRHPVVVELLGENYPLYYDNDNYYEMNAKIVKLVSNFYNILKAKKYLKKLDKSKLNINTFIYNLIKFVK